MIKKIQHLTLLFTLASVTLFAQQSRQVNPVPHREVSGFSLPTADIQLRAETDTLLFPAAVEDCSNSVTSFTLSGGWGFVGGTNFYGDLEKAQRLIYTANSPYRVTEVWSFFADAVAVGDGTSRIKVYAVNATTGGPGDLLGTSNALKTSALATDPEGVPVTIFPFSMPVTVTDDEFFVSLDLTDLYAAEDTVGIFSTNDNCGSGVDSWELFGDGETWVPINDDASWQLEANWVMGAVVEFDESTGVNDPFVARNGLRLFPATPNPTNHWVNLPYQLESTSTVEVEVYSADGKLLQRIHKGEQLSGQYAERLDVQALPNGTYVYGIVTNESRIMSRFVISR